MPVGSMLTGCMRRSQVLFRETSNVMWSAAMAGCYVRRNRKLASWWSICRLQVEIASAADCASKLAPLLMLRGESNTSQT